MKARLEELTPVKKKVFVEIEPENVDKKLDEVFKQVGKKAKIPGFRPGRIPRAILERHFGDQVAEDVSKDLVNDTLAVALKEVDTFPIGAPLLEMKPVNRGKIFEYSATMEVRPQFEVKDYLDLPVEKEEVSVTDDDVQAQLDQIQKSHGSFTSIEEERPIQKDDYVAMDYDVFENGAPVEGMKTPNFLLQVGRSEFHPTFETALIGLSKGDEKDIPVQFEETYPHTGFAGKNLTFKVKILDLKNMVLPELNDEFAQDLSSEFKDLADLKKKIKETLLTREEQRVEREVKRQVIEKIYADLDFELPQSLVEAEINYAVENIKQNLTRSGSSLEKAGLDENKVRSDMKPVAEKRVKELLILGQIAQQDQVDLTDDDMEAGFKEIGEGTGQDPQMLKRYYEAKNLMDSFKEKLLEEKTLNYLVEHAKITKVNKKTQIKTNSEKENS